MKDRSSGLIIGISIGVVIGALLAISGFRGDAIEFGGQRGQRFSIMDKMDFGWGKLVFGSCHVPSARKDCYVMTMATATIPIRANGTDTCTILSDSSMGTNIESSRTSVQTGIPDLQKATYNFTSLIGQGAFGPVYKAQMTTGEAVAVKVLATDSKQGEKEFQTEVMLLGRLHHRNLVNFVGYCAEKGQHMLIYVYMSKGSLASHLQLTLLFFSI
ncbi:hypothetical protein L1887_07226 [Cichorium endivia]|nr:hypothetical protein L1887_07226 [Cichorium endivia]